MERQKFTNMTFKFHLENHVQLIIIFFRLIHSRVLFV